MGIYRGLRLPTYLPTCLRTFLHTCTYIRTYIPTYKSMTELALLQPQAAAVLGFQLAGSGRKPSAGEAEGPQVWAFLHSVLKQSGLCSSFRISNAGAIRSKAQLESSESSANLKPTQAAKLGASKSPLARDSSSSSSVALPRWHLRQKGKSRTTESHRPVEKRSRQDGLPAPMEQCQSHHCSAVTCSAASAAFKKMSSSCCALGTAPALFCLRRQDF